MKIVFVEMLVIKDIGTRNITWVCGEICFMEGRKETEELLKKGLYKTENCVVIVCSISDTDDIKDPSGVRYDRIIVKAEHLLTYRVMNLEGSSLPSSHFIFSLTSVEKCLDVTEGSLIFSFFFGYFAQLSNNLAFSIIRDLF
eukprot:TRINITY_DN439_c0_g1_i1.p3 TRINITY_DN439_c0_g1~~TRINITY_DN439_c0_g1_i1.p3  ORF type:complete len:142 (+),score=19.60 TRINITY_DN439_c0_g1_i1:1433-1858(+)